MREYIHDIVEALSTAAKGMRITARYGVNPKEEVTMQYPEERWETPERFRGFLHNDIKKCTACQMCVKVCPVDCIALEAVRGADKKFVLASYDINIGRCMYCGLCVEVCPPKSLTHTSGYEKASVERGEMVLHFIDEPAEQVKARVAKQVAEAAEKAAEAAKAAESAKAEAARAPEPAPAGNPGPAAGDKAGAPADVSAEAAKQAKAEAPKGGGAPRAQEGENKA